MLHNAFVHAQAVAWAKRSIAAGRGLAVDRRLARLFREALGRDPAAAEQEALLAFLESQAEAYGVAGAAVADDARLWADVCHVLFNTKEFLYVR